MLVQALMALLQLALLALVVQEQLAVVLEALALRQALAQAQPASAPVLAAAAAAVQAAK